MEQQIDTQITISISNFLNSLVEEVENALIILSNETIPAKAI